MALHEQTVGIIGLGRIGSVVAEQLSASYSLCAWDIRPESIIKLGNLNVELAAPDLIAKRCNVILFCLPSLTDADSILSEGEFVSNLTPQSVLVDTSTSDPASARHLSARLAPTGAQLLDAPILGRPETCGSWTMPVGGGATTLERVRPVLEKLAARVLHVGETGTGHTIKLLNNLMFAAINAVTAEVVAACGHLEVQPERFLEIVGGSPAATVSPLFLDLVPRMIRPDAETVFTLELLAKDLNLAAQMCERAGSTLVVARALQIVTDLALAKGLGEEDSSALVQIYEATSRSPLTPSSDEKA